MRPLTRARSRTRSSAPCAASATASATVSMETRRATTAAIANRSPLRSGASASSSPRPNARASRDPQRRVVQPTSQPESNDRARRTQPARATDRAERPAGLHGRPGSLGGAEQDRPRTGRARPGRSQPADCLGRRQTRPAAGLAGRLTPSANSPDRAGPPPYTGGGPSPRYRRNIHDHRNPRQPSPYLQRPRRPLPGRPARHPRLGPGSMPPRALVRGDGTPNHQPNRTRLADLARCGQRARTGRRPRDAARRLVGLSPRPRPAAIGHGRGLGPAHCDGAPPTRPDSFPPEGGAVAARRAVPVRRGRAGRTGR